MQVQVKLMFFYNFVIMYNLSQYYVYRWSYPWTFKVSLILQKMFGVLYLLINGLTLLIGFCT